MDKHDKQLVEQACRCTDWYDAAELEQLVTSPEAKREIHDTVRRLHIKEETSVGCE